MAADSPYVGQIQAFAFNYAPRGWVQCNGQQLSVQSNQALFMLISTTFGGNNSNFMVPDLRGRAVKGIGTGAGIEPVTWGQQAGAEQVSLTLANLPAHTHTLISGPQAAIKVSSQKGADPAPSATNNTLGALFDSNVTDTNLLYNDAAPNITLNTDSTGASLSQSGGNLPVNVMQPFVTVNYCIAVQGVFPSRG